MPSFLLKIKAKSGQFVLEHLQATNTVNDLAEHLSSIVNIPRDNISILAGFPPKPLERSNFTKTLNEVNIKSGETLIVEESVPIGEKATKKEDTSMNSSVITGQTEPNFSQGNLDGILMRQVVPADNSCLFTSVGFVLGGKVDTTCGSYMRQIIAQELLNNEDEYSEAILGKPPAEYIKWIQKPESWGGAIELSALSKHYGLEIAVVDTQSGVINRFGEDKNYDYRVFLIFDGIHYDPLYREPFEQGASIQTLFLRTDDKALQLAEELAVEAKTSKQFTDVNRFTLRCLVCRQELTGQTQAQSHAAQTGHLK